MKEITMAESPEKSESSEESYLDVLFTGGIHSIPPISQEPSTKITRWAPFRVSYEDGTPDTFHLAGDARGEGRVCSSIKDADWEFQRFTTRSGRVYEAVGTPAHNLGSDASYVWASWCSRAGVETATQLSLDEFKEQFLVLSNPQG